jgi:hypothetical protein
MPVVVAKSQYRDFVILTRQADIGPQRLLRSPKRYKMFQLEIGLEIHD